MILNFSNQTKIYSSISKISIIDLKSGNIINEIDILKKSVNIKPLLESYTKADCNGPLHINYSRITVMII